jgi:hypothetical protein
MFMTDTSLRLDHLVVAVRQLETAVNDYARLGFRVALGGHHTHAPTRNALVVLRDGAYIELIEWLAPAPGEHWYERCIRRGECIIDFALCPTDFPGEAGPARERYRGYGEAIPGSRVQGDGEEIRWQLGWPNGDVLPFLCADVTPRDRRVPDAECRDQPNGVSGIASLAIQVHELETAASAYGRLFLRGAEQIGESQELDSMGLRSVALQVGTTCVYLVSPQPASRAPAALALASDLGVNGPRVYRVTMTGNVAVGPFGLDVRLAHGARYWVGNNVPLRARIDPL